MKIVSRPFLSVSLVAALSACAPAPETLFADGKAAFEAHEYRTAWILLEQALDQRPNNTEMQFLLVESLLKLGDGERANLNLREISPEMRDQERFRLFQAEADVLRGRFDEALAGIENMERASAHRLRALAHIGKRDMESAVESFESGMKLEPASPLLLATYARFEFERGNWNIVDELSSEALELEPQLIDALLIRAELLQRRNELPQSLAAFERVIAIHGSNFEARLGKARVLAEMGMGQEALEIAKRLQAELPDSPEVAAIRAGVAAQSADWETVRTTLQPFERNLPQMPDAAILYAEALIELGLPGQAVIYLATQFEQQPSWRKLRVLYATALSESGNPNDADAVLSPLAARPDAAPDELRLAAEIADRVGASDAARLDRRSEAPTPEWVGGQIAQADRALRNRQWVQAETAYLGIIERLGPSNAMVLNNLAFAQGELGKTEQALESALAAAQLAPTNASILDTAGTLLIANGQSARGIEMLREAEKLAPDNPAIKRHLAEAEAT
ncbi:tetratricopeptide repeat protein [Erythrobacter sp. Alg231-14]|uniref:tetratricopeptide repeat protein n=1 Tax=Erythrobacter sp. Alg231-14 TaxID=1922225 RepID=UPI000D54FFB9